MKNKDEKIIAIFLICIVMSTTTLQDFKLKFNLCMERQKDKLYYRVKWTKLYSLGGKLNQVVVQEVIQTLAIV